MKIIKYNYLNAIVHVLIWTMVIFFPYFISTADNQYRIGTLPGFYFSLSTVIHVVIFYMNALVLYPKFLNRTYWGVYIVLIILLVTLSVWLKFYILERWFPGAPRDAKNHVLFPSVVVFIISVLYAITLDKIRTEKLQKENKALQLDMQLKLLRNQISPHFLFNVFTNLIALARKKSGRLESSLLMLSGLMRYMLYDAEKRIPVQREVEYLDSYVALQQLRIEEDVKVEFNVNLPPGSEIYTIEPMLLIPFVENAFKHGADVDKPIIDVDLILKDDLLLFKVDNKFDGNQVRYKDESSGIGLKNVRSRLKLLYPDRHDLVIKSEEDVFSIILKLKLS